MRIASVLMALLLLSSPCKGGFVIEDLEVLEGNFWGVWEPSIANVIDYGYDRLHGSYMQEEIEHNTSINSQTIFKGIATLSSDQGFYRTVQVGERIDGSVLFHHDPDSDEDSASHIRFKINTTNLPPTNELVVVTDLGDLVATDYLNAGIGFENSFGRLIEGSLSVTWQNLSDGIYSVEILSKADSFQDQSHVRFLSVQGIQSVPEFALVPFLAFGGVIGLQIRKRQKTTSK